MDHSGMSVVGSEGRGVLTTSGRSLHDPVFHPQNRLVVDGDSLPSRVRGTIDDTGCSKKVSTWDSIVVADVAGQSIIIDAADAVAVKPDAAVENVNDKVRPTMGPFHAGKGMLDTRSGHRSSCPTSPRLDLFICGDRLISFGFGIALNAEVISVAAGTVTDVAGNATNTDLGAFSDLHRTATLSTVMVRSVRDVRPESSSLGSGKGDLGKGLKRVPIGFRASAAGGFSIGGNTILGSSVPTNADAFASVYMGFVPPSSFSAGSELGGRAHHRCLDLVHSCFGEVRIMAFRRFFQMEQVLHATAGGSGSGNRPSYFHVVGGGSSSGNHEQGREGFHYSLGFFPKCSVLFRSEIVCRTQHSSRRWLRLLQPWSWERGLPIIHSLLAFALVCVDGPKPISALRISYHNSPDLARRVPSVSSIRMESSLGSSFSCTFGMLWV